MNRSPDDSSRASNAIAAIICAFAAIGTLVIENPGVRRFGIILAAGAVIFWGLSRKSADVLPFRRRPKK